MEGYGRLTRTAGAPVEGIPVLDIEVGRVFEPDRRDPLVLTRVPLGAVVAVWAVGALRIDQGAGRIVGVR